jgi:ribosomal protein L24E
MPSLPPPTRGPLKECGRTPMPSVKLELGRYVTTRRRSDGTHRVFFQVPARLRPSDWLPLIPLPIAGDRRGDLTDAAEVGRIQADAKMLYERLQTRRRGEPTHAPRRSLETLVREYQKSAAWKALRPISQKSYTTYINHMLVWSRTCTPAHPDPTHLTRSDIEGFLSLFDDKPVTRKHTRKVLRLVMDQAVALGWRETNPCDGIRLPKAAKSKALIWEQADVDVYVAAAKAPGHYTEHRLSIALIILLEWEIGQRLTDVRAFRPGAEYDSDAGVFRFYQSKTDSYVTVPISSSLKELLNEAVKGKLFLFTNEKSNKAYTSERLSKTFAWVRKAAVKRGARPLLLRWLRHSCVVQLARASCTIPEIAAITGHSHASVSKILDVYLPRDNQVAWNAQEKRGLVARAGG